ncbi:TadE family protein [Salinimonas lutimaris]|uniref:TadE family protein n=1 Tax=Salinimonas lutimaris TaxID=914153 RepID=UPI0015868EFA|nr:TadE/TadG family type IV pilus assembly protein [Salinimonas lutimaris]
MRKLTGLHQQRGLAAIEFSLVAPIMFLLIFATAELGRMLYQYNALTNAVRDAGRYLSDRAYEGNTGIPTLTESVKNRASNLIIAGNTLGQNELLPGLTNADIQYSLNGEMVTVAVSYNWTPIFSDTLFSASGTSAVSLNFPMQVSYTMRASQ